MTDYSLGTLEASEKLLMELYVDLRIKVNRWSSITHQTPQARMGYVGQHLVSVVTGFPGGKSGARGFDLVIDESNYGEIKTCYRVDQLGTCTSCAAVVSSLEFECSSCGSKHISRKDDSKWLIGVQHELEFSNLLEPLYYYFVLFEFENIYDSRNNNIVASIWEVNPKTKGFAYCMIDYYLNIRARSKSKAPFNLWPHSFKFFLTQPKLIYRSIIDGDGNIRTIVFPTLKNECRDPLPPLSCFTRATTITLEAAYNVLIQFDPKSAGVVKMKPTILDRIQNLREKNVIDNAALCDAFSSKIYLPLIAPVRSKIPSKLLTYLPELW